MPSLPLRAEPSVRQTNAILARLERELMERGAQVSRAGVGALAFRMAHPWRARSLGVLTAVTSGTAHVSAGAGGPRRVRYTLRFTGLQALAALVSAGLLAAGWTWPRTELVLAIIAAWLVLYALPSIVATLRFRHILGQAAREVVERRAGSRTPTTEHPALPPDGGKKADEPPVAGG
jgi:hypothetical protein